MKIFITYLGRIVLLLILFGLLSKADCSREKNEPVCYMSEDFKEYVVFGSGSFWIYQSQSGLIDTVQMIDTKLSIEDSPYIYPIEMYTGYKKSTVNGTEYFMSRCEGTMIDCENLSTLYGGEIWQLLFFCCCEEGRRIENLIYISEDSISLNGVFYNDVKHFESDSLHTQSFKHFYYVKGIGLVKYENFMGEEWELLEYNIKD